MHAGSVATTNIAILLGLVVCHSGDATSTRMLLGGLVGGQTLTFIRDKGKGVLKDVEMQGDTCRHMVCAWRLAEQLPNS